MAFVLLHVCAACALAAGSWTQQKTGSLAWLRAVYFLDEQKGWAVGGNGVLLQTSDGGATWTTARRPTEDALRDVYFTDEKNGWIICERNPYQLKTSYEQRTYVLTTGDGGESWVRMNLSGDPDARLLRVLFTPDGRGLIFGEGGMVYLTRDGGNVWTRKRVPTRRVLFGGSLLDARQMWLVGAGTTIIQTLDGGDTWREGAVPLSESVRLTAVSFVDRARGWAVGAGGRVFMTPDGGRNWYEQRSNVTADLTDVKFVDAAEGWIAGAEGTLLHTTDGGFHWTLEPLKTTHPLERLYFINRERGWVVGFGGTIFTYGPASPAQSPVLKGNAPLR